ncbi:hypothetical protein [Muribaculum intestinale]|uniref:hypothetical protein n=1 Tax=Muribaculum intestinale TaxID=1796646 RepID=UPI0025A541D5|nr:hypothetical protein [Muribaculum intestinale]
MARGKQTCKILKEIRRQIAEANGIEFATSECRYKGDCLGTCPKCEAEVRYLEQQLRARSLAGKAVAIAGISAASLAMLMPSSMLAQIECDTQLSTDSVSVQSRIAKKSISTDIDGNFQIEACLGDSIKFSYIGYKPLTVSVNNLENPMNVTLEQADYFIGEIEGVVVREPAKPRGMLDLYFVDENGNKINPSEIDVYKVFTDENGEEDYESLSSDHLYDNDTAIRIEWINDWELQDKDGKPLKEATLRIEAEGYDDPITIKVKYPKRNAKKTIKFKHKKK